MMGGYLASALVAGGALAVFRTVLLYRYFDPYNNEYSADAKFSISLLGYLLLAAILLMATSYFLLRKKDFSEFAVSQSQFSVFSSALLGFVFAAIGFLVLLYYGGELFAENTHTFFQTLRIICFVLLFFSAAYFVMNAAASRTSVRMKKFFSFIPTVWALLFLVVSYINPAYNYTDPNHNFCNISIAALLLFFLYETRACATGKNTPIRFIFSLIALIVTLVYILPIFILMAFWELPTSIDVLFEAVECGAVFYIIAVICSMIQAVKPKESVSDS